MNRRKPLSLALSLALVAAAAPSRADRVRAQSRQNVSASRNTNVNRSGNVNVNRNSNVNVNRNVNVDVDRDVHVHGGYYGGGCCYYNPHLLVRPDGATTVLRSSSLLRPQWINNYMASDLKCVFGAAPDRGCTLVVQDANHMLITRRWYRLDLRTVEVKPGPQPEALFEAAAPARP